MNKEDVKYIVIHCSATQNKPNITANTIRNWHIKENGWKDIGYHWVIRTDGELEQGRKGDVVGAHVKGYNSQSIGICLVGGIGKDNVPVNNFTVEQFDTLIFLLKYLKTHYQNAVILGHRDFPNVNKECPCFDVKQWISNNIKDLY